MLSIETAQENHARFVQRVAAHERAWTCWGLRGPLIVTAEATARDVYLMFSDEAYARRALRESWPDQPAYTTREIALFELLDRWLPGLARDGHLVATNWTGDLIGLEVAPADLQAQLLAQLSPETLARYRDHVSGERAQR